MPLKGIPAILSPQLLSVLASMGHGDEIVLADANFPSASVAKNSQLIRADGHAAVPLLKAILQLLPLDPYVPTPVWQAMAGADRTGLCDAQGARGQGSAGAHHRRVPGHRLPRPRITGSFLVLAFPLNFLNLFLGEFCISFALDSLICLSAGNDPQVTFEEIGRMEFYERAKTAYAVIATGYMQSPT